jgi:aldehyde dehydrogenase (NAD+)
LIDEKMNTYETIFLNQKRFYRTHATKDIAFRKSQLKILYSIIKSNESDILQALHKDFRKSDFEGYGTEVGLVLSEISHHLKNIKNIHLRVGRVEISSISFQPPGFIQNLLARF